MSQKKKKLLVLPSSLFLIQIHLKISRLVKERSASNLDCGSSKGGFKLLHIMNSIAIVKFPYYECILII